jgi:4-hydroxybutyryl-CoA dehydratase/vinylacetyl-CoA-Delta-isomerase
MHGAGSPQAQRVQIARQMDLETKKALAKNLAGINTEGAVTRPSGRGLSKSKFKVTYFIRSFKIFRDLKVALRLLPK